MCCNLLHYTIVFSILFRNQVIWSLIKWLFILRIFRQIFFLPQENQNYQNSFVMFLQIFICSL